MLTTKVPCESSREETLKYIEIIERRDEKIDVIFTFVERPEAFFTNSLLETVDGSSVQESPATTIKLDINQIPNIIISQFLPSTRICRLIHDSRLDDIGGRSQGSCYKTSTN